MFNENDNILENIVKLKGCNTDKGREKHYYTQWYNFHFKDIRDKKINILEIGVAAGCSLNMWSKYFKNSNIYGIDITNKNIKKDVLRNFDIFIGDQSDKKFLKKVCNSVSDGFDIIIDDGSHIPDNQIVTFKYLFPRLNTGGVYVIEDLQTSYRSAYKQKSDTSMVDFLKKKVDDINLNGKSHCNNFEIIKEKRRIDKQNKKVKLNKYEKTILSMHFYTGLCFIYKR